MSKPSLYAQLAAVAISPRNLFGSPRHWNCGLFRYDDRLWLSYRFHLSKKDLGRCQTAIVELDERTLQPKGKSEWLKLGGPRSTDHHEDARLFLFRGEPYISYTEMRGYVAGKDYLCVMKYAKLRLTKKGWEVLESWQPAHGSNHGGSKEKNWVFFEHDNALHAVFSAEFTHQVIRLNGDRVEEIYDSPTPLWHYGTIRGGTPPIRQKDGTFLTIFHSSLRSEGPPNHARYYGAAYTFEGKPPFLPLSVSTRPIMVGSEADGHREDPRYKLGWKPFVVFPCGMVDLNTGWLLVSLGVNDWQCSVARMKKEHLHLGAVDGSDIAPRYFLHENGTMPVKVYNGGAPNNHLEWVVPRSPSNMAGIGYMVCTNPREAQEVADTKGVVEIGAESYELAVRGMARR